LLYLHIYIENQNGMRTPATFEKKISDRIFFFFFSGCFCRKFCHADVDSRKQQAILLIKKWKRLKYRSGVGWS